MEERPYSSRLKKIGELLEQDSVTREEVVSELGGQSPYTRHPSGSGLASGGRGARSHTCRRFYLGLALHRASSVGSVAGFE